MRVRRKDRRGPSAVRNFICCSYVPLHLPRKRSFRGMRLQEKGRVICEEGSETVLYTFASSGLSTILPLQVPPARNDEKTSTISRRFRCKYRREPSREQCGWQLANISARASSCMTVRLMPGELFLSWRLRLQLALFISRVCGHRWSKNMRFTAGQRPRRPTTGFVRYGHAGTPTHVVLPDYRTPIIFVVLFVSSSAIGRRTTDAVEPLRMHSGFRKGSPSQGRVLFRLDKIVRINVYVAKGTCMHRLHHTLLCKNFEKKEVVLWVLSVHWWWSWCSPSAVNRSALQRPDPSDGTGRQTVGNERYGS
jgi:hypothetical protein